MDKEPSNKKISVVVGSAMVLVALFFDLVSIIPVINIISDVIGWMIFTAWFYFLGAGLLNPKKFATVSLSFLVELIPFLSILPTTTIGVCVLIFMQNHPILGKLANKGLNTKKQTLNKKVRGFEQTQKKPQIQDVKKKEETKETTIQDKKKTETKADITPQTSAEKPTNSNNQGNKNKEKTESVSENEKTKKSDTSDKKESNSKENNSEDQRADYEKNKQDLKNIEYLQGKIPQRRLIKDIDIPAPYGEGGQDELDLAA